MPQILFPNIDRQILIELLNFRLNHQQLSVSGGLIINCELCTLLDPIMYQWQKYDFHKNHDSHNLYHRMLLIGFYYRRNLNGVLCLCAARSS